MTSRDHQRSRVGITIRELPEVRPSALRALARPAQAVAVFASLLLLAGCGSPGEAPAPAGEAAPFDFAGVWSALLEHDGTSSAFILELDRSEEGTLDARITIPEIEVYALPAGKAQVSGLQIKVGPLVLTRDAGGAHLRGVIPKALLPVHSIEAVFSKIPGVPPQVAPPPPPPSREPAWTFTTGSPVWAGVILADGVLFAGSDDGSVTALDASTGAKRWSFPTEGAIRARPTLSGRSLLVQSDDGHLYCLDAVSGRRIWRAEAGGPVTRTDPEAPGSRYVFGAASPVVDGATVYVAHPEGALVAVALQDGKRRWSRETGDPVTATPLVHDGLIYVGSFNGRLMALNADGGAPVREHDTGAPVTSSPALLDNLVISGSRSYDLFALHASDLSPAWTHYMWFSWVESSPTVDGGMVYVGSSDGQMLHAIDGSDGRVVWKYDTGGSAWGSPAVTADEVFIGSVGVAAYTIDHRGGFHAVDRESGEGIWRYVAERPEGAKLWGFAGSPAAGNGMAYAGGLDGRIYAFRALPGP